MNETPNKEATSDYILRMLQESVTREEITRELLKQGHDMRFIDEIMTETITLYHTRRRSKGLTLILVGAFVCFASFLLTITGVFSGDAYGFALFGLTTAGVVIAFAGFVYVF
jgi:hypothetical protein